MPDIAGDLDHERTPVGTAELRPLAVILGTDEPEEIDGTPEDDDIRGRGGDDVIRGLEGDDVIRGGAGDDVLRGNEGDDRLLGGIGADRLFGNTGDDVLLGQGGSDVLIGGQGEDELRGGAGRDELRGGADNDQLFGGGGDDELFGNAGDDQLFGGPGNDLLVGGAGNDILRGQGGDDELRGGGGNDQLIGGAGNDILRGGPGSDVLDGKQGQDTMYGGGGADTFRFTVNDGAFNRIEDFNPEVDRLDLKAVVNFQPGDNLDDFVLLEQFPEGTRVSIDPNGAAGGQNFTPLVGLFGTQVASLSLAQLGLAGGAVTERTIASTDAGGTVADGPSFLPSLSQDGRVLAFASVATNLTGTPDTDGFFDIFLKDLDTGEVTLLSRPIQGANESSFFPAISDDGGAVAFDSAANLPGDLNPPTTDQRDVFLRDVDSGDITFVSIEHNRFATTPAISGDGNLVAFRATATARAEGDPEGEIIQRIYVRDVRDGSLFEASTAANGDFANDESVFPAVSGNGQFVAFDSLATNLVPNDENPGYDVFVKTVDGGINGAIELASTNAAGNQVPGSDSRAPAISADGRYVAFHSDGAFVGADTNGTTDVYRKDLQTGQIVLVSRDGSTIGNGESLSAAISDDGNLVAFRSAANNLVAGDDNGFHDIFVKNLTTGEILRFEVDSDTSDVSSVQGVVTLRPALSGDGSTVAFSDQVSISDTGGIAESQVAVAPVEFGTGAAALQLAEVLDSGPQPAAAPAGGGALTPMSLDSMLTPEDAAAV